jgi:hypothetical protein
MKFNLIKKFQDVLRKNKAEANKEEYNRGYDYAAGVLLRGEMSGEELMNLVDEAKTFGNYGLFDLGIVEAINRFYQALGVDK